MADSKKIASENLLIAAYILLGAAGVSIFLCMPVVGPALIANFGLRRYVHRCDARLLARSGAGAAGRLI